MFQGTFGEGSRVFEEWFEVVSRKFQKSFKEVSTGCRGSFKRVSMMCPVSQGCYKKRCLGVSILTQTFSNQKSFGPKICFLTEMFLDPHFSTKFLDQKVWTKILFDPNFFNSKIFWTQNLWTENLFFNLNFFGPTFLNKIV